MENLYPERKRCSVVILWILAEQLPLNLRCFFFLLCPKIYAMSYVSSYVSSVHHQLPEGIGQKKMLSE